MASWVFLTFMSQMHEGLWNLLSAKQAATDASLRHKVLCSQSVLSWLNSCMHKTVLALVAVTWIRMLPLYLCLSFYVLPVGFVHKSLASCILHDHLSLSEVSSFYPLIVLLLIVIVIAPVHLKSGQFHISIVITILYIILHPCSADNYFHLWS